MHNGLYPTMESALQLKVEMAFLARMGGLRNPDPELAGIRIMEDDFAALFAFLNALSDAGTRTAAFHSGRDGASRVAPSITYSLGTDSDPAATVPGFGAGAAGAAPPAGGNKPDEMR